MPRLYLHNNDNISVFHLVLLTGGMEQLQWLAKQAGAITEQTVWQTHLLTLQPNFPMQNYSTVFNLPLETG